MHTPLQRQLTSELGATTSLHRHVPLAVDASEVQPIRSSEKLRAEPNRIAYCSTAILREYDDVYHKYGTSWDETRRGRI